MNTAAHDPINRALPKEDHLALMARDFRSPFFARMYADTREGKWAHAHEILNALERRARQETPAPHKDKEHAWSARAVADRMDIWRAQNMHAEQTGNRVNAPVVDDGLEPGRADYSNLALDDAGALGDETALNEIKGAKPPCEPEEAS